MGQKSLNGHSLLLVGDGARRSANGYQADQPVSPTTGERSLRAKRSNLLMMRLLPRFASRNDISGPLRNSGLLSRSPANTDESQQTTSQQPDGPWDGHSRNIRAFMAGYTLHGMAHTVKAYVGRAI